MSAITLAQAKAQLANYLAAEQAVLLQGQEYIIAGRRLNRADLAEIRNGVEYWQGKVNALQAADDVANGLTTGAGRVRRIVAGW